MRAPNILKLKSAAAKSTLFLQTSLFAILTCLSSPADEVTPDVLMKRDLGGTHVRFLNIESNFILPRTSFPYFIRLYSTREAPSEVHIRDEIAAEQNYEQEEKLSAPINFYRYSVNDFLPPNGHNLVEAPDSMVNLTSAPNFNLARGGMLNLYVKAPLQAPERLKFYIDHSTAKIRTYLVLDDGKKILFDRIFIYAKTIFGHPTILRGIAQISFQYAGKDVYDLY